MVKLVIIGGNEVGAGFELTRPEMIIGRQQGVEIKLQGNNVSRRHARILKEGAEFFLEDLGSSNGTFLNQRKLMGRASLKPRDEIRIGPYRLQFDNEHADPDLTIRARVAANTANAELFRVNPAHKLQVLLELSAALGRALETEDLLRHLLDRLFELFPNAERGLVILMEKGKPVVRAHKQRSGDPNAQRYSSSIVQKAMDEGTGIFADDLQTDSRFSDAQSICALKMRSVICVPLRTETAKPFGALQLDRMEVAHRFTLEDLHLLTAIGLQISVALENAHLHQELLARQRIERELGMAREIQIGYLPKEVPVLSACDFELHGELTPAYEISGDFYDYFKLDEHRLVLVVADVSGKGMPAALFMSTVRALMRNLALSGRESAVILRDLNNAVAAQNPNGQFVTVMFCIYDCESRVLELASAGHPPSLVRRRSGEVEILQGGAGPLLGFMELSAYSSNRVTLGPGDLLLLYTDGITEAPRPDHEMFGLERLRDTLSSIRGDESLPGCAEQIRKAVHSFTGSTAQEDDITMALLRIKP